MEKHIENYENYVINDSGDCLQTVWSVKSKKYLRPAISSNGYYTVNLCKDGKTKSRTLHSLIAEAFIPNLEEKPCIDHINGIRTDNRVENLRWCSYQENNRNPIYIARKTSQKRSEETKNKMSEAHKGKVPWIKGKHHTDEAKEKNRLAHLGKKRCNKDEN